VTHQKEIWKESQEAFEKTQKKIFNEYEHAFGQSVEGASSSMF
jgi:hypothetical protein